MAPRKDGAEDESSFWRQIQAAEAVFEQGLKTRSARDLTGALLEVDRIVWKGHQDLENPEFIAQARERFRDMVVALGDAMECSPAARSECFTPMVEIMLRLRERFRREKRWSDADVLRDTLSEAGIVVEDTPDGVRWKLRPSDA